MIEFIVARGHDYTLRALQCSPLKDRVSVTHYDEIFRRKRFPHATYVFVDLDRLGPADVELAGRLYLQLNDAGMRVLNDPRRQLQRHAMLRALHDAGLNDFRAYRADELPPKVRFPAFVRKANNHLGPLSKLLESHAELEPALDEFVRQGVPLQNLLVVEFAAEPLEEGIYRKLTAFRVGESIWPHTTVHGADWMVKDGRRVASEQRYIEELESTRTRPHVEYLRRVFELARIEYGRADFGLWRGRIQIYEINTNPCIHFPISHRYASRRQSMQINWQKYLDALEAVDSGDGKRVDLRGRDARLDVHRTWKSVFVRTRPVE